MCEYICFHAFTLLKIKLTLTYIMNEKTPLKKNNTIQYGSCDQSKKTRIPFHVDLGFSTEKEILLDGDDKLYYDNFCRYKYYQKLINACDQNKNNRESQNGGNSEIFRIPNHMIPKFYVYQPDFITTPFLKRIITIFTLWNTMVGSGMLAMPWAFYQAGYAAGICLTLTFGLVAYLTCLIMLKRAHGLKSEYSLDKLPEYTDVCGHYLGSFLGRQLSIWISMFLLTAAAVVFWILMSSYLYGIGQQFYHMVVPSSTMLGFSLTTFSDNRNITTTLCPKSISCYHLEHGTGGGSNNTSTPDHRRLPKYWKEHDIPFYLVPLVYPLIFVKSPTFFAKLNSFGTISILLILIFVAQRAISCYRVLPPLITSTTSNVLWLSPFSHTFTRLTGILALAFLIHNAFLSILNANPARPMREMAVDLAIAYGLATFTYTFIGFVFYYGFFQFARGGSNEASDPCPLQDNFLKNVPADDLFALVVRLLLFFQLLTVVPLIAYLIRSQLFPLLFPRCCEPTLMNNNTQSSIDTNNNNNLNDDDNNINGPPRDAIVSYSSNFGVQPTSLKYLIPLNTSLIVICVIFARYLPNIGTILRFAGGFCGFVYIFLYPSLIYIAANKHETQSNWLTSLSTKCILSIFICAGLANFIAQFFN